MYQCLFDAVKTLNTMVWGYGNKTYKKTLKIEVAIIKGH